jgi:hypothetical protein
MGMEREHMGGFAEGQEELEEHTPDKEHMGSFAEGVAADMHTEEQEHMGGFAEGQRTGEAHPEREARPDYSRGISEG